MVNLASVFYFEVLLPDFRMYNAATQPRSGGHVGTAFVDEQHTYESD